MARTVINKAEANPRGGKAESQPTVQALVYIFILAIGVALGATAYMGLAFTVIEAALTAAVTVSICLVFVERTLRARSEKRFEKAVDDLSRLLSTDAQAGQVLTQRINALSDIGADERLKVVEADMSVLGTVVRQVAEAVSELETNLQNQGAQGQQPQLASDEDEMPSAPNKRDESEPVIPVEMLRLALEEDRMVIHSQPIITLPQRQTYGFDIVPRLMLEDGDLADPPDFMPRTGNDDLVRQIERKILEETVTVIRRARNSGEPATLFVPMSRATFSDAKACDALIGVMDANRVVANNLVLSINETEWRQFTTSERARVSELSGKGVSFSVINARSLRLDYGELSGLGVTSVRTMASTFIERPEVLTDFELADVAPYLARFDIDLIIENITNEQQILTLLDDGVRLATGPHIARPAPIRPDHMVRRQAGADRQRARIG